jgi:hypothetical protein
MQENYEMMMMMMMMMMMRNELWSLIMQVDGL